jgi:hypothetical protein
VHFHEVLEVERAARLVGIHESNHIHVVSSAVIG